MDTPATPLQTIEELQKKYDRLRAEEKRYMKQYDIAPDGSIKKVEAIAEMNRVGSAIRGVEREINEAYEEMEL